MEGWVEWLLALPAPVVWTVMVASAAVEYVFPPFPGDAIALGGGVLAGSAGLFWPPVFAAVTLGSVLGAWIDYELGRWLTQDRDSWLHRWSRRPRVAIGIARVTHGFAKHGDLYLVINRFLPGIRAFFFIAAGLAGVARSRVIVLATLSALAWNGLLLGIGLSIGANLEAMLRFLATYSKIAWVVVIGVLVVLGLRWLRR